MVIQFQFMIMVTQTCLPRTLVDKIRVLHVLSHYQNADIFTKGFPLVLFEDFGNNLSIRQPPASTVGARKNLHKYVNNIILSKYIISFRNYSLIISQY